MRILAAVQCILAIAFILFGLVTLFGIGITGLLFLLPGAVFAASAGIMQEGSRAATAAALAADAVLGYLAARKLGMLIASETAGVTQPAGGLGNPGPFAYLPPSAALVLVCIGVLAVLMDWRALRNAPWF